jgi:hypothetical protein
MESQRLEQAVERFKRCIQVLPGDLFAKPMDGWSPRDVTAHLIGWNGYTLEGCQQIVRGQTPFYFTDADNDYSNVNAESVRTYTSTNKLDLLEELDRSFQELRVYLASLNPFKWRADYGVKHGRWIITVANTVDALCDDYDVHWQEIEQWASKIRGTG